MGIATSMPIQIETMKAAGVIVARRFVIGPITAATVSGSGGQALGVAVAPAAIGEHFAATTAGREIVESGAAITDNALVQSDGTGRAIPLAAGACTGRARVGASAAGVMIEVDLIKAVPPA